MVNVGKIKQIAKDKGIALKFITDKLGVHNTYLINCQRYGTDIPDERLQIIADCLDTTVAYLRDETDNPNKEKRAVVELTAPVKSLLDAFEKCSPKDRDYLLDLARRLSGHSDEE